MKNLLKLTVVAVTTLALAFSGTAANAAKAPGKPHKCGVVHVAKKPLGKKALDKKVAKAQLQCKTPKSKKA